CARFGGSPFGAAYPYALDSW
nr:immunoglobulin heavy chain junction region [Macaca mulatta]MOW33115.1 immunoglobulin heavy chain junction region [Macaca mulatta]